MSIRTFFLASALTLSGVAVAGPHCTDESSERWIPAPEMLGKAMQEVTRLKLFKVTDGNCYEIYGWNAKGEKLEIYYHPVTGEIAKKGSW
ncbi:MAG: PepSY domain-containing protein [Pseudomonadota bacterium]